MNHWSDMLWLWHIPIFLWYQIESSTKSVPTCKTLLIVFSSGLIFKFSISPTFLIGKAMIVEYKSLICMKNITGDQAFNKVSVGFTMTNREGKCFWNMCSLLEWKLPSLSPEALGLSSYGKYIKWWTTYQSNNAVGSIQFTKKRPQILLTNLISFDLQISDLFESSTRTAR